MEKGFDFNKIGKRMPYKVPAGAFDAMEDEVMRELHEDARCKPVRRSLRRYVIVGLAVAACAASLVILKPAEPDPLTQVDIAYNNLSADDQAYLSEVYQEDIFINQ